MLIASDGAFGLAAVLNTRLALAIPAGGTGWRRPLNPGGLASRILLRRSVSSVAQGPHRDGRFFAA
ncbi:hypothetical protein OHU11_42230 (plasmid) [Streptomyces sp. NBC_00257]|uniref:hypothetical protein n=1 Tax=unclassified Streptomyces TaxID=2593676 RepID=UPI0022531F3B|nr:MULTISPECIES: hypothetical protein [unclassified Streptomyces]MCX5434798.1 hypothetical protein [Streptomyces sp. NBC_00062]WTD00920.1 hypothetical protein OH736_45180 [Streptomyces sp. NBC_01650]